MTYPIDNYGSDSEERLVAPDTNMQSQPHSLVSGVQDQASQVLGQVQDQAGQVMGQVQDQASQVLGQVQDQAGQIMGQVQDQAGQLAQQLQQQLGQFLTAQKDQAAHMLDDIATVARNISEQLRTDGQATLASAVESLADHIHAFAMDMEQKTLDQIVHDIEQGARSQTVLLVAGGLVLGLLAIRVVKSTHQD